MKHRQAVISLYKNKTLVMLLIKRSSDQQSSAQAIPPRQRLILKAATWKHQQILRIK